jgi:hypothetical protein
MIFIKIQGYISPSLKLFNKRDILDLKKILKYQENKGRS